MIDRLSEIFKLQMELGNHMPNDRYPKDLDGKLSALATAIIHEGVELQRETNWKWWKKPVPLDTQNCIMELIDISHFTVQGFIELGVTPDMMLSYYQKKHQENIDRQVRGY